MTTKLCACGSYHELDDPHFTGRSPKLAEIAEQNRERNEDALLRRVVRLETIVAKLCDEAAHGQGSMGKQFWEFVDQIRAEHAD